MIKWIGRASSGVKNVLLPSTQANFSRRKFFKTTGAGIAAWAPMTFSGASAAAQDAAAATDQPATFQGVRVLLPQCRVPLSFIIDDSTCLVNMGHFCTPQFAAAWPNRPEYQRPWREWPREIPDAFVRKFGIWCSSNGVKGKYSIVPYPACVGWLDRELPGWSRRELRQSIELVRELMTPNWDIHPEMITHTRVIDIKTGRPMERAEPATMENSYPQEKKSVDELASYLAYALRILKNCGLNCEGITTPGGFGSKVKEELPRAVDEAVRDVFACDLPHYFKYVRMGSEPVEPTAEFVRDQGSDFPKVTMNVPAGTGDWFGGWQGVSDSEPDRYLTEDGLSGRMADLIRQRQPAVMLCHWPGMYCNGSESGFLAFQRIVNTLREVHGDETLWMKVSEIGQYWAAKQFTRFVRREGHIELRAPFAAGNLTLQLDEVNGPVSLETENGNQRLQEVAARSRLRPGSWLAVPDEDRGAIVCLDLPKGNSILRFGGPS